MINLFLRPSTMELTANSTRREWPKPLKLMLKHAGQKKCLRYAYFGMFVLQVCLLSVLPSYKHTFLHFALINNGCMRKCVHSYSYVPLICVFRFPPASAAIVSDCLCPGIGNGWARRSSLLPDLQGGAHEEVGLRLAPMLHVQNWNMLGHQRSKMGSRGEFMPWFYCLFLKYLLIKDLNYYFIAIWRLLNNFFTFQGKGDVSGGCKCGINGIKCHPKCNYCH
jgi:hypothetical protein